MILNLLICVAYPHVYNPFAQEFVTFVQAITKEDKDGLLLKDDYRELIQLRLLLLNSFPKDASQQKVRSIECVSNSRWMAKVICEQKMALYSAQLLQLKMIKCKRVMEQHRYLALFRTIIYVKPWIQCPFPFEAAVNDLNLFHLLSSLAYIALRSSTLF